MPTIHDEEFGTIIVRRSPRAMQIRIRVAPNGTLKASMPPYAPLILLKRMVKNSRTQLRQMMDDVIPKVNYRDGQKIGIRHTLVVKESSTVLVAKESNTIVVGLPASLSLQSPKVIAPLRELVMKVLREEARAYLPKRLAVLAGEMGCTYERIRFSHASSRWGSCSSTGTISLNIALMKLPHTLIDYVLIHELAHTKQMNHSQDFWSIVARFDPSYLSHKKQLALETPTV